VPIASIVEGDGRRANVFVLDTANGVQIAKRRSVDVAFIDGVNVAITKGVAAGEKIVTDGALYLQDGEHVLVRDAG
jgi:multidrug efflux pump subunit AcrA (membrane-fusion protein)